MKDSARLPSLDEGALVDLARALAPALAAGGVVYLRGDLGAGKTTFARALLQALGVGERVKSPTYSLIESYRTGDLDIHHLDLYRIADPGELEWLGLDALWRPGSLVLVEWPQRGGDRLPAADLVLSLAHAGIRRDLVAESGGSARGHDLVTLLAQGLLAPPVKR
ncbi:MAG: tRNA (adenosine(37)-N6)-threonylcarbamoyltransferase complex ATPase subunit type 1 TsaE [Lysobacteraceae bacterium]|nr:MAG: tRNA (adenosine(37)-N6)-threonylcarbamoyltransferase complex ATPase subunit type 1 TsaE [Xanthomonadaceae bacterium]